MDNFHIETAQNVTIQQNVAALSTRIGSFLIDGFIIAVYYIIILLILNESLFPQEKLENGCSLFINVFNNISVL